MKMKKNETNKALEGLFDFPTLEENEEREAIQEQVQEIETKEEPKKETKKATKTETEPQKNDIIESTTKKKAIGRPRINPTEPYKITFIVDEEIEEYMKQQPFITMESRKDYVNRLITEDFEKRIGATSQDTPETIQRKWNEYKERVRRNF
jgi:hypothetical protein